MVKKSAYYYDVLYRTKNYAAESQRLLGLIRQYKRSSGTQLLDIGCGTGRHLAYLQADFQVVGLDIDEDLLEIAAQRLPDVQFHCADMIQFDLQHKFDVITCLFSAIGYTRTLDNLNRTIATMAHHLSTGGVLLVEPWLYPQYYIPDPEYRSMIDAPPITISVQGTLEAGISVLHYIYEISTINGVETFDERHELGLFTHEEYLVAFTLAGLETHHHMIGVDGRGLFIGIQTHT